MIYETSQREKPLALVVDDELSLPLSMCAAMTKAGFDVIEAENGREALASFYYQPQLEGVETEFSLFLTSWFYSRKKCRKS